MKDFLTFQFKLFVDGLKDGVVFSASIVAFVLDLILRRKGNQRFFYRTMKLSLHFDDWLNLHGVVEPPTIEDEWYKSLPEETDE